jgi:hypothetical protein
LKFLKLFYQEQHQMKTWKMKLTAALVLFAFTATLARAESGIFKRNKTPEDQNAVPSHAMTAAQSALLDKAFAQEKVIAKSVSERSPLFETYIQNMRSDAQLQQVPDTDNYMLNRLDLRHGIGETEYGTTPKPGFFTGSVAALAGLTKALKFDYVPGGFASMLLLDPAHLDRQHYNVGFVKREFLGSVRTSAYDIEPKSSDKGAQFLGRIWVEEQDGNIVRFNGSFGHSSGIDRENTMYHHFDSWRNNVQPGVWLPVAIYIEQTTVDKHGENIVEMKAITHIWGYALKVPNKGSENVTVSVDNADNASTNDSEDVSPLGAERAWVQQAEDNVVERLTQAGLLDEPSDFDKILEQIANNILIENNIPFNGTIRCRTLLTSTLESVAVGNTIILSKGLQDTMFTPSDTGTSATANLASMIAFQLAHIILGHRLDTRYAFNDHLLFPDSATFVRIPMHHTDADNIAAARKAIQLLSNSEFKDRMGIPGLYLLQLQQRAHAMPGLLDARLGDSMAYGLKDKRFFLEGLMTKAPKLNMEDLKQEAAMPLGSLLRIDPWTDQVVQLHYAVEAPLNGRDKMPFEVTPVYYKLAYFKEEAPVAPAAAPADTTAAAPAATPADATAPTAAAPAAPAAAADTTPVPATPSATAPAAPTPADATAPTAAAPAAPAAATDTTPVPATPSATTPAAATPDQTTPPATAPADTTPASPPATPTTAPATTPATGNQ